MDDFLVHLTWFIEAVTMVYTIRFALFEKIPADLSQFYFQPETGFSV